MSPKLGPLGSVWAFVRHKQRIRSPKTTKRWPAATAGRTQTTHLLPPLLPTLHNSPPSSSASHLRAFPSDQPQSPSEGWRGRRGGAPRFSFSLRISFSALLCPCSRALPAPGPASSPRIDSPMLQQRAAAGAQKADRRTNRRATPTGRPFGYPRRAFFFRLGLLRLLTVIPGLLKASRLPGPSVRPSVGPTLF